MGTPTLSMERLTPEQEVIMDNYYKKFPFMYCDNTYYKLMQLPQLSLDFLQNSFQVKPASKTFKTTPRDGISLEDCFKDANRWLRNQSEYTRVEFPYDGYYYVVAKLSEAK